VAQRAMLKNGADDDIRDDTNIDSVMHYRVLIHQGAHLNQMNYYRRIDL
jgi:hypothetical protein